MRRLSGIRHEHTASSRRCLTYCQWPLLNEYTRGTVSLAGLLVADVHMHALHPHAYTPLLYEKKKLTNFERNMQGTLATVAVIVLHARE